MIWRIGPLRVVIELDWSTVPPIRRRQRYAFAAQFFHPSWRRHNGVLIGQYLLTWALLLIATGVMFIVAAVNSDQR